MRRILALVPVLTLIVAMIACGDSPTAPTPPPKQRLTINPTIVHMKVGDSQVFTAEGGDGVNYGFSFWYGDTRYFNLEKVAANKAKVTYVTVAHIGSTNFDVSSGDDKAYALIYLQR